MTRSCYIHIPFCSHICSYCDFSKMYYNSSWCNRYLDALEKEINSYYKGEELETIYIGGGTPTSLSVEELKRLFTILDQLKRTKDVEFTIECNVENISLEKLKIFLNYGVNRISVGVESTHPNILSFLERPYTKEDILRTISLLKEVGFENINIDLMYAIPEESIEDLEQDLNFFLALDIPHISTYSLMIEEHTKLGNKKIEPISEEVDEEMYQKIHKKLENSDYQHYEISNFGKKGYFSKHNLTYWRNNEYYGFGLGASGFVDGIRYTNTKNFHKYEKEEFRQEEEIMNSNLDMENEIMLGLRTIEGVSKERFQKKFGCDLKDKYEISELLEKGYLIETKENYYIPFSYWYLSNEIIVRFIGVE